jgi:hypothetical protein
MAASRMLQDFLSPGCAIDRRRRWMTFMQQSIRNEIPGTVKEIISDKVLE